MKIAHVRRLVTYNNNSIIYYGDKGLHVEACGRIIKQMELLHLYTKYDVDTWDNVRSS